jgi:hypothetical protein
VIDSTKFFHNDRIYLRLQFRLDVCIGHLAFPADAFTVVLYQDIGHQALCNLAVSFVVLAEKYLAGGKSIVL